MICSVFPVNSFEKGSLKVMVLFSCHFEGIWKIIPQTFTLNIARLLCSNIGSYQQSKLIQVAFQGLAKILLEYYQNYMTADFR